MGRGRDEFWDHAEKLNRGTRFRCNYCESEFAGGATRIKHHLSQHKGGDIQICPKVPDHVRLAAIRAIDPHDLQGCFSNKKRKQKSNIASSSSSSQTEMGLDKRKATSNFGRPDDDQIVVDTKLAEFMMLHNIPLAVAEAPLFDEFVKCVADFRTYYQQPPCRATLERQLEYDVPKQVEEYTKHVEASLLQTGCTFIFNPVLGLLYAWTSKGLVFKGTLPFNYYEHEKKLYSTIQSLGPEHIIQIIIDDDYDHEIPEVYKDVFFDYPRVCVTHCATREILNFFCKIAYKQCSLGTCAGLVFLYMKKNHPNLMSLQDSDLYSNCQSSSIIGLASHLLHCDEWGLEYVVAFLRLKSLLEFEDKLQALQLPVLSSNDSKDSRFFYCAIKHREFWIRGKQVVRALQPVFELFCLLITNTATVGYFYQLMERANNLIQGIYCCSGDCIRTYFNKMYKRIISPIHAVAALLNPAYLCSEDFRKENKDIKQGIDFVLNNIVRFEERDDFMSQLITYQLKDPKLFTTSARALLNTSHPGEWWKYCGNCVPVLQKYALKIVSQPCSFFFTHDESRSIIYDDSFGRLKSKVTMMKKSITQKDHLVEATKLVDQLAALLDVVPYCFHYDRYFRSLPGLDDGTFWNSLEDSSISFLDNLHALALCTDR